MFDHANNKPTIDQLRETARLQIPNAVQAAMAALRAARAALERERESEKELIAAFHKSQFGKSVAAVSTAQVADAEIAVAAAQSRTGKMRKALAGAREAWQPKARETVQSAVDEIQSQINDALRQIGDLSEVLVEIREAFTVNGIEPVRLVRDAPHLRAAIQTAIRYAE